MRTTLSLDDDVAGRIQQEVRRTGDSFKATVNRLIRLGLTAAGKREKPKPYVVTPRNMGLPPGLSYDSISELLEEVEGPYHR